MRIISPFDLINMVDDMEVGECKKYYHGDFLYDIETKPNDVALIIWKLSITAKLVVDEEICTTTLKRVKEHKYDHYIRKISKRWVPDHVVGKAEILEERTVMREP